ncbi:MAG: hypothetical protein JXA78_06435 [Anaerolineales bacterium]|nr:hypothetical protein [Anaerolineales bacterium]
MRSIENTIRPINLRSMLALLSLGLLAGLAACRPRPPTPLYAAWEYGQLRALDPAEAAQPGLDLLAAYLRVSGDEIQIRLELLDHAALPDYDLYLAIDHAPGGANDLPLETAPAIAWDTLLAIPALGPFQALDANLAPRSASGLLAVRDPILDTILISLPSQALSPGGKLARFEVQVLLAEAGSSSLADSLGPFCSDAPPPPPARVLFAFWDTYPAYTPLTALRRWSGAHSGPNGGSHGLGNLLSAARAMNTPLALLDLKNPAWLSALDYGGKQAVVDEMLAAGLLILPEYAPEVAYAPLPLPDWAALQMLEQNRNIASEFGLPPSQFIYLPSGSISEVGNARLAFIRQRPVESAAPGVEPPGIQPVYVWRWRELLALQLPDPGNQSPQATLEGPSLETRRALLETALAAAESGTSAAPILALGGSLPASAWGDPLPALRSLRYLASRPWVQPVDARGLLSAAPAPGLPPAQATAALEASTEDNGEAGALLDTLREAPNNPLGRAAWQAYAALFAPVQPTSPDLPSLRSNYVGDVWSLLAAAAWAQEPAPIATCDLDPDHDGQPECLLASRNLYTQFEIESGALTHAFAILTSASTTENVHQWIAPSSQFISGLSDPLFWDLGKGAAADPGVLPGAFAEPGQSYQASLEAGGLFFVGADGKTRKSFRLTAHGLEIAYRFAAHPPFAAIQIPLALDPWRRFSPGWANAYRGERLANGWAWSLESSVQVRALASTPLTARTFLDSRPFFEHSENPDKDYPAGHTLPFPLALLEIPLAGEVEIWIEVR